MKTTPKQIKVIAVETSKCGRWHFATRGISGKLNLSVRTWASKQSALRAGRREYNVAIEE